MTEYDYRDSAREYEAACEVLSLEVSPDKMEGFATALDPDGAGTFKVPEVLLPGQLEIMRAEVFDPCRVPWRDNHSVITNKRGTVIQNHDVFALKLSAGDQKWVERVPRMRALASQVQALIRSQSKHFPALSDWEADEMSLHRYDDPEVGLGRHADNPQFWGLIAVLTLEGESDFETWDEFDRKHAMAVKAGDLALTRGSGLFGLGVEAHRPDHAVVNVRTAYRTSFIVRANNAPERAVKGFKYDNWPGIE